MKYMGTGDWGLGIEQHLLQQVSATILFEQQLKATPFAVTCHLSPVFIYPNPQIF
ncbi:hypothetical protein Nos7524_3426 [Nostoc sp. PCC 7524]|uniref:hypothetical protein n=1 Tax=Nostoc sp. (strain ATCC 29411 / PCC 7524) TaxID=28072 RepID=UPI00029F0C50|nr:hypothetical protein [Nostoc sp. PCC 7524]AFY49219.1 hypothetical protein Nos7524_3426 [Nostoc sp. PCC 7524]